VILTDSPFLTFYRGTIHVGNNGVGVRYITMNVRNNGVGICKTLIMTDVGND